MRQRIRALSVISFGHIVFTKANLNFESRAWVG